MTMITNLILDNDEEDDLLLQSFLASVGALCGGLAETTRRKSMFEQTLLWHDYCERHVARGTLNRRLRMSKESFCKLLNYVYDDLTVVSGPVVRPTDETHACCITNGYLRMKHDRRRCNGIGMISRGLLNKSSLFQYFILCVV